jgi:hypothetical protein
MVVFGMVTIVKPENFLKQEKSFGQKKSRIILKEIKKINPNLRLWVGR